MSWAVIAIGSATTAFWFHMPRIAMTACMIGAGIAAAVAIAIMVLLHHGMLSTQELTKLEAEFRRLRLQGTRRGAHS